MKNTVSPSKPCFFTAIDLHGYNNMSNRQREIDLREKQEEENTLENGCTLYRQTKHIWRRISHFAAPQEKKWWATDILWATLKSKYLRLDFWVCRAFTMPDKIIVTNPSPVLTSVWHLFEKELNFIDRPWNPEIVWKKQCFQKWRFKSPEYVALLSRNSASSPNCNSVCWQSIMQLLDMFWKPPSWTCLYVYC